MLYRDSLSEYRNVRFGVNQGSILGPLLFLCLIMDLPAAIMASTATGRTGCSGYADDTVVWSTGNTVEVKKDLESISANVAKYMVEHNLVLNRDKTQVLFSGGSSTSNSFLIDGVNVTPSDRVDLLGVSFDHRLSPTPHQEATCSAARSIACAARRLAMHLPRQQLQQVLLTLIVGKLGYGCASLPPRLSSAHPSLPLQSSTSAYRLPSTTAPGPPLAATGRSVLM